MAYENMAAVTAALTANLQTFTPTTGSTVTIAAQNAQNIFAKLSPAGLLAALTIALPVGSFVGQQVHVHSTQAITTVSYTVSSGNVIGGLVTWLANGYATFYFDGTNWNRIG